MSEEQAATVLARMVRRDAAATPDVPLTASRAVRLAITRAAETSIGLVLQSDSVLEQGLDLDPLVEAVPDDGVILGLTRGGGVAGVLICSPVLAHAAMSVQVTGRVDPGQPDDRRLTAADIAMLRPFAEALLRELGETTPRTALDGWIDGVRLGRRIEDRRGVGFALADQPFRLIRVPLDIHGTELPAEIVLALPQQPGLRNVVKPAAPVADWEDRFRAAVMDAPARLDAVLHRLRMPLTQATHLKIGQVVPLTGCTLGRVRMVAGDGRTVARGRLGQIAGQIAVRLNDVDEDSLVDLPAPQQRRKDEAEILMPDRPAIAAARAPAAQDADMLLAAEPEIGPDGGR